jgi:hypothetical protein
MLNLYQGSVTHQACLYSNGLIELRHLSAKSLGKQDLLDRAHALYESL